MSYVYITLFLTPCWESPIRLFISKCVISLPLTNLSMVLQTTVVRLNRSVVSRFLPASFLVNRSHVCWFPVFRYNSCFYWIMKYVCEGSSKFVLYCKENPRVKHIWSSGLVYSMFKCCSFSCTSSVLKLKVSRIITFILASLWDIIQLFSGEHWAKVIVFIVLATSIC